jgi:hypothetical protein
MTVTTEDDQATDRGIDAKSEQHGDAAVEAMVLRQGRGDRSDETGRDDQPE